MVHRTVHRGRACGNSELISVLHPREQALTGAFPLPRLDSVGAEALRAPG
jgi:hypothetical protein